MSLRETVFAAELTGTVVSVLDGDTIEVLHNNRAERIRLNGIDCPETGQAHGKRVKQAASELVFGKQVTLQTFGKDKYGRTIAEVLLRMAPTSITHRLKTAGAGDIESMRRGIHTRRVGKRSERGQERTVG